MSKGPFQSCTTMPKVSSTGNVRKVCKCPEWKACPHPWYVDHRIRGQRLCRNMDLLLGRHLETFDEAKAEAAKIICGRRKVRKNPRSEALALARSIRRDLNALVAMVRRLP